MRKIQATQVIARLPILPIQKQETKMEKTEAAKTVEVEPMPGTSVEQPAAEAENFHLNQSLCHHFCRWMP